MSTKRRSSERSTAVRPNYVHLGTDAEGRHHTYRTSDESVLVVRDGQRIHREVLGPRSVDDWMAFVDERIGWDRRDYGVALSELVERAIGGDLE